MLELGRFTACVVIEGEAAPEYNVERDANGKSVSCWIASELGKKFAVSWTDNNPMDDMSGRITIDGTEMDRRLWRSSQRPQTITKGYMSTSRSTRRPFMFGEIQLTDDDAHLDTPTSNIGSIQLKLWRIMLGVRTKRSTKEEELLPEQIVHERSKKTGSHQVKLGALEVGTNKAYRSTTLDPEPVAIFEFKYRSSDYLQAQGIMPPPSTTQLQAELREDSNDDDLQVDANDEEDDPDATEVKELQRRLRDAQERLAQKEQKKGKRMQEHGSNFLANEVIDLTADDQRPGKRLKREQKPVHLGLIDLT